MRLDRLINDLDVFDRPTDARRADVTLVTEDAREVVPGALFCCVPGATRDGHDFAQEAVEKGAIALVVERELPIDIPQVRVPNARAALAPLSATFYDHPDKHLRIAGITGTNGKTTTTQLLASIFEQHHWKTGTIGTLTGVYTTPPAPQLQRMLAEFRDSRHQAVVMEVASQALDQYRVDAMKFNAAVFTNLTQDHLDYHKTMNRYFEAKAMLFDPGRSERAIVNGDDEWGRKLIDRLAVVVHTYSLSDAKDLQIGVNGSTFIWNDHQISLKLIGEFNVYNALAAATTAKSMGITAERIAAGLNAATPVRGRVEQVDCGQDFTVLVDFAHTPDGLVNVLDTARIAAEQNGGRVIAVFGHGGDRDADKRPKSGGVLESHADLTIITNDNPRTEDPATIAQHILGGMSPNANVHVELDRTKAIKMAIKAAEPGDVVVIAGKGHETYQEVHGVKHPYDDREVAAQVLNALGNGGDAT